MYLDVTVEDLDSATHTASALGARTAEHQASPDQWRVLLDPAGPFPPYRGPTDLVPTRFRRPSANQYSAYGSLLRWSNLAINSRPNRVSLHSLIRNSSDADNGPYVSPNCGPQKVGRCCGGGCHREPIEFPKWGKEPGGFPTPPLLG